MAISQKQWSCNTAYQLFHKNKKEKKKLSICKWVCILYVLILMKFIKTIIHNEIHTPVLAARRNCKYNISNYIVQNKQILYKLNNIYMCERKLAKNT